MNNFNIIINPLDTAVEPDIAVDPGEALATTPVVEGADLEVHWKERDSANCVNPADASSGESISTIVTDDGWVELAVDQPTNNQLQS